MRKSEAGYSFLHLANMAAENQGWQLKNAGKFSACKEYTYREKLNGQWIEDKFYE